MRKLFSGASGKALKAEIQNRSANLQSLGAEDADAKATTTRPGLSTEEQERIQVHRRADVVSPRERRIAHGRGVYVFGSPGRRRRSGTPHRWRRWHGWSACSGPAPFRKRWHRHLRKKRTRTAM